jgi:hypothetical protein
MPKQFSSRQVAGRFSRIAAGFAVLLGIFALCDLGLASPPLDPAPAGKVRFYNIADSDFDRYSKNPNKRTQAWMRAAFTRMQTYSPYFDKRLRWYPNAWVYKDSYALKPHWPEYRKQPDWVLRDAQGNQLYIPWGCQRGSCPQFAADMGNPEFQAHWIEQAREKIAPGYRGIWVDDVNLTWRVSDGEGQHVKPIDPRTGKPMLLEDWRRYFAEFMEALRAALPDIELAHNAIWYAGEFDDPAILRQIDAADYINLERGATDSGLRYGDGRFGFERFLSFIDLVHQRGRAVILMDYGSSEVQREFSLAAYLLVNNGRDLLSSNQLDWTGPETFWPGYRLDLGAALGPRESWRGLLRRDFACGRVLLNQPGGRRTSLVVPGDYRALGGRSAGSLQLAGGEAMVLLKDCASVPN